MAQAGNIRVLIAVDGKDLRDLIRLHLEEAEGVDVVGDALNLEDAVGIVQTLRPDVTIMADRLPPIDCAHAAAVFQKQKLPGAILVISTVIEYYLVFRCFLHGVKGFMQRDEMRELLLDAVRKIYSGNLYFSPKVRDVYKAGFR